MLGLGPIELPEDVIEYIRSTFHLADQRVTSRLDRMPTVHEEWLDFALIEAISEANGPHITKSGVIIDIAAHFVGGGVHWRRWEIADLGFIVNFRRSGQLIRSKVVLFQSKRLYPREAEFVEDIGVTRSGGFGSLMQPPLPAAITQRSFSFDLDCRYKALQVGDQQWQSISEYEQEYKIPVHYLLYHPNSIPSLKISIPVLLPTKSSVTEFEIGSRVIRASEMRVRVGTFSRNHAPSYAEVRKNNASLGLGLAEFFAEEVLGCREGYVVEDGLENEGLNRVFNQRTAPIAAAIRVDISLP